MKFGCMRKTDKKKRIKGESIRMIKEESRKYKNEKGRKMKV